MRRWVNPGRSRNQRKRAGGFADSRPSSEDSLGFGADGVTASAGEQRRFGRQRLARCIHFVRKGDDDVLKFSFAPLVTRDKPAADKIGDRHFGGSTSLRHAFPGTSDQRWRNIALE